MKEYSCDDISLLKTFCNHKCYSYYYQKNVDKMKRIIIWKPVFASQKLNYLFNKYYRLILNLLYTEDYTKYNKNDLELITEEDIKKILEFLSLIEENNKGDMLDDELFEFINCDKCGISWAIQFLKGLLMVDRKLIYSVSYTIFFYREENIEWLFNNNFKNPVLLKLHNISKIIKLSDDDFDLLDCFITYAYLNTDCSEETLKKIFSIFRDYYDDYQELCDLNNIQCIKFYGDGEDSISFFENYFDTLIKEKHIKQKKLGGKNG